MFSLILFRVFIALISFIISLVSHTVDRLQIITTFISRLDTVLWVLSATPPLVRLLGKEDIKLFLCARSCLLLLLLVVASSCEGFDGNDKKKKQ